jgi:hypothetical protein
MISCSAPDLTQHPPRSPRVRLGDYVHLPRLLDKARAYAAGKNGEYNYNCPLDKRFFSFVGIDADTFLDTVKAGKGDVEMLAWVNEHTPLRRTPWEIDAWSHWLENLGPGDAKRHAGFAKDIGELSPGRDDIRTNFDRLDLDDYISFGGKA